MSADNADCRINAVSCIYDLIGQCRSVTAPDHIRPPFLCKFQRQFLITGLPRQSKTIIFHLPSPCQNISSASSVSPFFRITFPYQCTLFFTILSNVSLSAWITDSTFSSPRFPSVLLPPFYTPHPAHKTASARLPLQPSLRSVKSISCGIMAKPYPMPPPTQTGQCGAHKLSLHVLFQKPCGR